MISTVINGGLGNQLFIYAAARAMALRNGTDLAINIVQGFKDDKLYKRHFELGAFNVKYRTASIETFNIPGCKVVRKLSRIIGRNILLPNILFIKDSTDNRGVDSRILQNNISNAFLEGYWQSYKYFEDFEEQIREDLTFRFPIKENVLSEEKEIFSKSNETPISVGVRRYQECIANNSFGDLTVDGAEFYIEAMNIMAQKVNNPVFYIFTQDKTWVEQNILPQTSHKIIFMKYEGKNAIDDLYLQTCFKYHIVSNSSYYWWGAWLANSKNVICTKNFFNHDCALHNWFQI